MYEITYFCSTHVSFYAFSLNCKSGKWFFYPSVPMFRYWFEDVTSVQGTATDNIIGILI